MKTVKIHPVLISLVLLMSFSFLAGSNALAAEDQPIKIGLILPYTGTVAPEAKHISAAVEMYFIEKGMKAGGRTVQIIKEDEETDPTAGLTKARRLVEHHKVNFVVGPVSSAVALAIHDYLRKQKVIQINPSASTRELTAPDKASPKIFRTADTTDQGNYPMGRWMAKNTAYRNVVIAATDRSGGRHSVGAFKAGFEEGGGKVVKEVYPKLGTMDFASYLSSIDTKGADAVYAWFPGTDAIRFVQQYQEFGLKKRLPLFGYGIITDDPYLATVGDPALGIVVSCAYTWTLDTPQNRAFVKVYQSKWGEPPSPYSAKGYVAAQLIGAAIDAMKGDIEDTDRLAETIRKVASTVETPTGPLAFDQYNQRIMNMYVAKVEKRNGKLANVMTDNLGKVSQADTWKWWMKK
jgi:branched-chain amino acid transport system substrate-binding protein